MRTVQLIVLCIACLLVGMMARADNPDPIALIGTPEHGLDVEQTIDIAGVACPSRDATTVTWVLEYGEGMEPTTWTQLAAGNAAVGYPRTWQEPDPEESEYGLFFSWDTTTQPDGFYTVRVRVTDGANKTASDHVTYYIDNLHVYGSEDEEPDELLLDGGGELRTYGLDDWVHGPPAAPEGPKGVPFTGTYTYYTPKSWGKRICAITSKWRVRNGRIVATGQTWCRVTWDGTSRTAGYISYVTTGHKRSYAQTVGVWDIAVVTDPQHEDREKIYNTASVTSLADERKPPNNGPWYARAISAVPEPAIAFSSTVFAYGPSSGLGRSSLKVGYLQAAYFENFSATFTTSRTQNHYYAHGKSARDCVSAATPWLYNDVRSIGVTNYHHVRDFDAMGTSGGIARISMFDTPFAFWPRQDIFAPEPLLRDIGFIIRFNTWVQAATQEQDGKDYNYCSLRQVDWTLNMCGSYTTRYTPGPAAGILPGAWGSVRDAAIYTGDTANILGNRYWFGPLIGP